MSREVILSVGVQPREARKLDFGTVRGGGSKRVGSLQNDELDPHMCTHIGLHKQGVACSIPTSTIVNSRMKVFTLSRPAERKSEQCPLGCCKFCLVGQQRESVSKAPSGVQ